MTCIDAKSAIERVRKVNDMVVLYTLQVEFAGGALRCGEYVTLRKVADASQKVRNSKKRVLKRENIDTLIWL